MDTETIDLTQDRPTAVELLEIIAETLQETVVPATAPHAQHQARIAANLCRILGRQLASPTGDVGAIGTSSLVDADETTADAAFADVLALVRSKLAVVKPGYDAHDATAEAGIVA